MGHRLIKPVENHADGILFLGPDFSPDEKGHQHGGQRHRQQGREEHGKGLRVGQRFEEPARLGLQGEDGEKSHGDDEKRKEERGPHFLCRLDDDVDAAPGRACGLPLFQLLVGVFHHDDGGVHHGSDGDGDAGKTHDVGGHAQVVHADEGYDDRHGKRADDHERAGQVKQKNDADHADGKRQLQDLVFERVDGPVDEIRAVIGRDDLHAGGKARFHIPLQPLLHPIDDIQDVLSEAHDDDPSRHLAPPVEIGQAPPDFRADLHAGHVPEENRRPAAAATHGDVFQVLRRLDISSSPHHVLDARQFEDTPFHIPVALPDRLHHLRDGNIESRKAVGVDGHLVLLHETADGSHLGYAGDTLQGKLDVVILDGAELSKVMLSRFIHHGIGKSPAETRRIGPQDGIDVGGEFVLYGLQVFQDPASRPVDVRPFLEDDIDEGTSKKRKAAHDLDFRRRKERGGNGIGDLILDEVRAPSEPLRVDNDLRVGQIGDGVQRRVLHRPGSPGNGGSHEEDDDKLVSGAVFDDPGYHAEIRLFRLFGPFRLFRQIAPLLPLLQRGMTGGFSLYPVP